MIKKIYESPVVRKVHLEIKNSLLSVCHSSLVDADDTPPLGCRSVQCFEGATP